MQPTDDRALLRQFVEAQSDPAFAALVARHVNLVYSVAWRHVGDAHHAEEITQAVFIILAKKAGQLRHDRALTSWLFQTTRLTAGNFLRSESRRRAREQEAYMQSTLNEPDLSRPNAATADAETWLHIAPWLDTAVAGLGESDRRAILLRFYEGRSLREVGTALDASEAAAEKRVTRAVEKLRKFFTQRGVTLTATVLTAAISANSVQAAPLGLAATVTATAAKGAAISGSTLTLIKGALKVMAWTKMKTAIVIGAGVLLAAGTAWSVRDAYLQDEDLNNFQQAPPMVMIQKTHFLRSTFATHGKRYSDKAVGRNIPLSSALGDAYGFHPTRIIFPPNMPATKLDFIVTTTNQPWEKFQAEIEKQFGFVGRVQTIETNVLLLRLGDSGTSKLKVSPWPKSITQSKIDPSRFMDMRTQPLSLLTSFLENEMGRPVVDQTGLTNFFDIVLEWNQKQSVAAMQGSATSRTLLRQAIHDQLGLELINTNMPIEMLVVEKK
jgi:uncharacterized protein (TIGR03435 family)